MLNPVLSIIIISYNTSRLTLNCIRSVFADKGLQFDLDSINDQETIPSEIIVIDNDSHDDSVSQIKHLQNVRLIENKQNLGFAKANNQGLKIARGNYVLLLNSDTLILHSAVSQSLNWLSAHPEASVCTAQILNKDKTIQGSGGYFPNLFNLFTWSLSIDDLPLVNKIIPPIHPHTPQFYTRDSYFLYDHRQEWITGAFILIRKSVLDTVGYFDENYFMYGEELELCYRIKAIRPQTQFWYLVGPQIIHYGGASAVTKSDPIIKEYQGMVEFFRKHKPTWQLPIVKLLLRLNVYSHQIVCLIEHNQDRKLLYQQICSKI